MSDLACWTGKKKKKIEGQKGKRFVYKEKIKHLLKKTVWQSVVIRAGDGGESHEQCGKGIVQKFQSKDTSQNWNHNKARNYKKNWRRFLCYGNTTKAS